MNRETPLNDPQLMWQSLQREHSIMSLEEVRVRAQDAYLKLRRDLIVSFILGAVVFILSGIAVMTLPFLNARITAGALMILTTVAVFNTYRRLWLHPTGADFAATGCVSFYRTELEAQHRSLQMTWRFLAAIAVLSFLTPGLIFPALRADARIVIPLVLLVIMIERRHQALKIKRKLVALDDFQKGNA